jgi:hypothetical protein
VETRDHLFLDCPLTIELFHDAFALNQSLQLTHKIVFFSQSLSKSDLRLVSIFKFALWNLRNKCRILRVDNKKLIFKKYFEFFLKKFF